MQYSDVLEKINSKKGEIARAIAMAYANGDVKKFEELYPSVYLAIKETKEDIFNSDKTKNGYALKVDSLFREINEIVGFDTFAFVSKKACLSNTVIKNDYYMSDVKNNYCVDIYKHNRNKYIKYGISLDTLMKIYSEKGYEEVVRLNNLMEKANKLIVAYNFKDYLCTFYEFTTLNNYSFGLINFMNKYNIKSFDDVLEFRKELVSFISNRDNPLMEETIERNKNKVYNRLGKEISSKEANKIIKKIDFLLKNSFIKDIVMKKEVASFFKKYGYKPTLHNISGFVNVYLNLSLSWGVCTILKMSDTFDNFCFFNTKTLDSRDEELKNSVIIHEYIHSVDNIFCKNKNLFSKFNFLNEALTEYIAGESVKYLEKNILNDGINSKEKGASRYDFMLFLLDKLIKSNVWEDLFHCKIYNDCSNFEKKYGKDMLKKINKAFGVVYQSYDLKTGGNLLDSLLIKVSSRSV